MKCPTSLCEAMVVLSLYKKTHIGYTQYADNDVYVDDVDDDEAGAGAYHHKSLRRRRLSIHSDLCSPFTLSADQWTTINGPGGGRLFHGNSVLSLVAFLAAPA